MTLPDFHDITWTTKRLWVTDDDGVKRPKNTPVLKLLTPDGIEHHTFPFKPYCYLQKRDFDDEVRKIILNVDKDFTSEEVSVGQAMVISNYRDLSETFYDTEYFKIELSNPRLIRKLRQELANIGVNSFQSDITFSRRVMIDLGQSVTPPDEILSFDIEVESEDGFPDPDKADQRVFTICAVGSDGEEYVFADDDEKTTIENFLEVAEEYKAIMGWNSYKFDYPYLQNRCDKLDIYFDWFKVVHVDALPTYRHILMKYQQNYRLETVAENEFGMTYDDVDYSEMQEIFDTDRDTLIEYNLADARVVKKLNDKYELRNVTFDILATAGYCRPRHIFFLRKDQSYRRVTKASNVLIEGVVLNVTERREPSEQIIWPNKGSAREKFEGAKVLDPKPGKYEYALTLDFSSMYPSIISAFNIGPETFRPDGSGDINAPIGSFVSEPQSVFSESYHVLQDQRDIYTERQRRSTRETPEWHIAKAYSIGIKQYVNTFYGVIGSPYSRFYNRDVAENITKIGQEMLMRTAEFAEECGYTVIYGDTDSVIIALPEDTGDPVEEAYMLAGMFSAEIRRFVKQEFNGNPDLIELTVDEVYSPFFITDAKKRYAGYCIYDGEPCFTYDKTGFESVRGDWPTAAQNFQDRLLRCILDDTDVWDYVDDTKRKLMSGELDTQLIKHVGLRSAPDHYDSLPPHVRVAKRHEGTDTEFRVGDKVPYIKFGSDPKDVVAVTDPNEIPHFSKVNYNYLWNKNFQSILDRFGLERTTATTLSDYAKAD